MFTHHKSINSSTVRVLRMLMHLCAGQVTLLPGEFHPSKFVPQIGLRAPGELTLGLAPNFYFSMFFLHENRTHM